MCITNDREGEAALQHAVLFNVRILVVPASDLTLRTVQGRARQDSLLTCIESDRSEFLPIAN